MSNNLVDNSLATVPAGVDDAVGVCETKWFAAIVNPRHEKSVAEKLHYLGVESYVATQEEMHVWKNGKKKLIERVVIPSTVFVKCTEKTRREIVTYPFILRFIVNRSADTGTLNKPVAVIPDDQMARLRFMLGQNETSVNFSPTLFRINDNVRVVRGHMKGLVGEIIKNSDGTHTLTVSIPMLGGATMLINPRDVVRL
ncbi:MAG: UpxY family transcription antiterminator [Muribaculaceae bacterium]|nr:UpxY family transcription antiterminator [Muribaculaceae bacterium]